MGVGQDPLALLVHRSFMLGWVVQLGWCIAALYLLLSITTSCQLVNSSEILPDEINPLQRIKSLALDLLFPLGLHLRSCFCANSRASSVGVRTTGASSCFSCSSTGSAPAVICQHYFACPTVSHLQCPGSISLKSLQSPDVMLGYWPGLCSNTVAGLT